MTGAHHKGTGWGEPKNEKARKTRARTRARYWAIKEGKVKVGDGKVIDHIKPLSKGGAEDAKSNLRVRDAHSNDVQGGKLRHHINWK